jgi:hypothetical protein
MLAEGTAIGICATIPCYVAHESWSAIVGTFMFNKIIGFGCRA